MQSMVFDFRLMLMIPFIVENKSAHKMKSIETGKIKMYQ